MNYMLQFCLYETNLDVYKIREALEDLMDEEFDTICEDGSPKGIVSIGLEFYDVFIKKNSRDCFNFISICSLDEGW